MEDVQHVTRLAAHGLAADLRFAGGGRERGYYHVLGGRLRVVVHEVVRATHGSGWRFVRHVATSLPPYNLYSPPVRSPGCTTRAAPCRARGW